MKSVHVSDLIVRQGYEDVVVVDLDHSCFDIWHLVHDMLIRNSTVQRIAKGLVVRLDATHSIVVVFLHGDDALIVNVLVSIGNGHKQPELGARCASLRQQEPVGDAGGALVHLEIVTIFGHLDKSLVGGNIRHGYGGF